MKNEEVKSSEEITAILDLDATVKEENEQIKAQRYFQVNFTGGFEISTFEELETVLKTHANVYAAEYDHPKVAYLNGAAQYVDDYLELHPCTRPDMPTYEFIKKQLYHEPNYQMNIPAQRFFACMGVISEDTGYVGIYDSIQGALDFIDKIAPCHFKEFPSYDAAYAWINALLAKSLLTYSAYIGDFLPILEIPLNQMQTLEEFLSVTQKPLAKLRNMFIIHLPYARSII